MQPRQIASPRRDILAAKIAAPGMGNTLSAPSLRVVCAKGRKPSPGRTPPEKTSSGDKVLSSPEEKPAPVPHAAPQAQDVAGSGSRKGPGATDLEVPAAAGPSTTPASQQLVELTRRGDAKALAALLDRRGEAPALGGLPRSQEGLVTAARHPPSSAPRPCGGREWASGLQSWFPVFDPGLRPSISGPRPPAPE